MTYEETVRSLHWCMVRYARKRLPLSFRNDAEDVVQTMWLHAGWPLPEIDHMDRWLKCQARRRAVDWLRTYGLRSKRGIPHMVSTDECIAGDPELRVESRLSGRDEWPLIHARMQLDELFCGRAKVRLSPQEQSVVRRRRDGWLQREIGAEDGLGESRVCQIEQSIVARAQEAVKK